MTSYDEKAFGMWWDQHRMQTPCDKFDAHVQRDLRDYRPPHPLGACSSIALEPINVWIDAVICGFNDTII